MNNCSNYDSDETYFSQGESFINNNFKDNKVEKIDLKNNKHKNESIHKIISEIQKIKDSLNTWFETNKGLPIYILNNYISKLKKYNLLARNKVKSKKITNYYKWFEIFQVSEKLQELIGCIIKKNEKKNPLKKVNSTFQKDDSEINDNPISYVSPKDNMIVEEKIAEQDYLGPSFKILKLDKSQQLNEKEENILNNYSCRNTEPIIIPNKSNTKRKTKKRNTCSIKKNKKNESVLKLFDKDNFTQNLYNNSLNNPISNTKQSSMDESSLQITTNLEKIETLENNQNKYNKIITLKHLSECSPEKTNEILNKNQIMKLSEFWPHIENEFVDYENSYPDLWKKGEKIPEEFYKDLDW